MTLTVTVMSWNVLADAYIRPRYYPGAEPALLVPRARTAAIVEHVMASEAAIACLQEVEPALADALRAEGLAVHHVQKHRKPDGCAIVVRAGVVVDGVRSIVFGDGAPDREDSGHVAIMATLAIGSHKLAIATTHLRWDPPGTAPAQRWAVRETAELLAAIRDWPVPWIAGGDLNVEPDDAVHAMFLAAGFRDPAAHALVPTANPNGRAKRIDHLFGTAELAGEALPGMAIDDATPLPAREMPSDHIPILARFTLA